MAPAPPSPTGDSSQSRLLRGFRRSTFAAAILLGAVAATGAAAWHLAGEAMNQRDLARSSLWQARMAQIRSERLSSQSGRRRRALEAARHAATFRITPDLRDEAIAALALADLEEARFHAYASSPAQAVATVDAAVVHWALARPGMPLEVRNLADNQLAATLRGSESLSVAELVFSRDGRWLASRRADGPVDVWDWRQGRLASTHQAGGETGAIWWASMDFGPADADGLAWLIWTDPAARLVRGSTVGITGEGAAFEIAASANCLALSPDGALLALGLDRMISVRRVSGGDEILRRDLGSVVRKCAWDPAGRTVGIAHGNTVSLLDWRLNTVRALAGHRDSVMDVFFHPRGHLLGSAGLDGSTRLWRHGPGTPVMVVTDGLGMGFSIDGRRLAYRRSRLGVGYWDAPITEAVVELSFPTGVTPIVRQVALSPDGKFMAAVNREGVALWSTGTGRLLDYRRGALAEGVAFSSDGNSLFTSSTEGLLVWKTPKGPGYDGALGEPEPVAGGEMLTQSLILPGAFGLLCLSSRQVAATMRFEEGEGYRLETHPWPSALPLHPLVVEPRSGRSVQSVWKGGGTRALRWPDGMEIAVIEPEGGMALFSPRGDQLLTASRFAFSLWNPTDWSLTWNLPQTGANDVLLAQAFSPTGDRFVVADRQSVAAIYDLGDDPPTRRWLGLAASPGSRIQSLALGYTHAALGLDDGTLALWSFEGLREELLPLGVSMDRLAEAVEPRDSPRASRRSALLAVAVVALALGMGWHIVRYQRDLIADLLRIRSDLLAAHRMQALGTLSAGIAHDFRNLLSVIRMSAGLLRRGVSGQTDLVEEADAIEAAVIRGDAVVRSLLGYTSRGIEAELARCRLSESIPAIVRIVRPKFLGDINLRTDIPDGLPDVAVPQSQLDQILLNLIVNAVEALDGSGRIDVAVSLGDAPADPDEITILPPGTSTSTVRLTVSDNGPGVAPEQLPRIFEPFHTTKRDRGRSGTGLGLSTVLAICERHGLGLLASSMPGRGAAFTLLLPSFTSP